MKLITLVDRGRGLQLSTSRVTVQDLVQYFLSGCSREEIKQWIPTLTDAEIAVVEEYYMAHKEKLDAEDQRVQAYREAQLRIQRERDPYTNETGEQRRARMRQMLEDRRREKNGAGNPG